ncbi:hypothetical protein BN7_3727 [Wickerhamomyces ciferrii]|uniref:Uncharacterized protein n=1 Tax=Wickerhamomyces ciferrii (strain ATCC 14091 / BCRC 22168 / CBS 111 / JCM 3599 / NBRC 0793 / NRRL Y-1031 F-60-10) TaxID=1206466 RepID=K0KS59_WICCF|nr:uncharacterized protein BN7_3727 [Wickerhamomyces ciferrii]CCH44169.1 hypothetical protein BN7_3727 [Wickerhamomyces ciferrii]
MEAGLLTGIKNLKSLLKATSDYEKFKVKYQELSLDFQLQLQLINETYAAEGPKMRNYKRKELYLTRFDVIIKPTTLRVKDIKEFNIVRSTINNLLKTLKPYKKDPVIGYLFEVSSYFNLAPPYFPDTGRSPLIELKLDNDENMNPFTTTKISKNVTETTRYGPVLIEKFTNDVFKDEWDVKLVFELYKSESFKLLKINNELAQAQAFLNSRCLNSFTKRDLVQVIKSNIFNPVLTILSNLGYSITIRENYDLKNDLPEKSKVSDVPDVQFQLVSDMCLIYHKPISDVDIAAMTILVCEPSTLNSYVQDFLDDKGKITHKSNNLKNLFTQGFCQAIFALNNHGIITDYNHFLLYTIGNDVSMQTKKTTRKNFVKVATSGFHCEVLDIKDGSTIPKITSFVVDNVKAVVDNSEECLIRHIKEFMMDLD